MWSICRTCINRTFFKSLSKNEVRSMAPLNGTEGYPTSPYFISYLILFAPKLQQNWVTWISPNVLFYTIIPSVKLFPLPDMSQTTTHLILHSPIQPHTSLKFSQFSLFQFINLFCLSTPKQNWLFSSHFPYTLVQNYIIYYTFMYLHTCHFLISSNRFLLLSSFPTFRI